MPRTLFLSLFVLGLVSGCAQSPEDDVGSVKGEIINGSFEPAYDHVMYLLIGDELCTATLIAPRVVLTAKHCLVDAKPESIFVGRGSDFRGGTRYAFVKEVRVTSGKAIEGKDLGLLFLDRAGNVEPARWVQTPPTLTDPTITAVGFGQQLVGPAGKPPFGVKMRASSRISESTALEFAIDGPTTCFGDSGGPAFLADGRLVGVVSRGSENCNGYSIYTRTDAFRTWIAEGIVAAGDTAPVSSGDEGGNSQDAGVSFSNEPGPITTGTETGSASSGDAGTVTNEQPRSTGAPVACAVSHTAEAAPFAPLSFLAAVLMALSRRRKSRR